MPAETLLFIARRCRAAAFVALIALAASSCGRIGPLEPPPDPNAPPKPAASASTDTTSLAGGGLAKPKIPPIVPPKQPFFLDPLLK